MKPDVSVIIPAFNRVGMIARALASIQRQSLQNIEIIVVDDGSTDGTAELVQRIDDPRIRTIVHPQNRGIPAARNTGLEEARGRYIAWLDSDDTAREHRLAAQSAFLDTHSAIAMIGTAAGRIRLGRGGVLSPRRGPKNHEVIKAKLLFRSAFQQSSIMGRAEILKQYPYRTDFPVCEDLEMFIRFTRDHRSDNLPEVLIDRYLHAHQTVHRQAPLIVEKKKILFRQSLEHLGLEASERDIEKHVLLGNIKGAVVDRHFLDWSEDWLARIIAANERAGVYDSIALKSVSKQIWQKAVSKTRPSQVAGYYLARFPPKLAARKGSVASHGRRSARDRKVLSEHNLSGNRKWLAQGAVAILLVTLGWMGRGYSEAGRAAVPPTVAEADEARDLIAANGPEAANTLGERLSLARANGLPMVVMPSGWRVVSSAIVSTEIGRMIQMSAITSDGVAVTIVASNDIRGMSRMPVITAGNDESIASWKRGSSGFAVAAQMSPDRFRRAALELYGSSAVS